MTEYHITKEDVIIVKNLQDGHIYSNEEISEISGVPLSYILKINNYITEDIQQDIIGDGSGIVYIMDIKYDTIVDGEGFRNTVYCAKCNMFCNGCHNQNSHDIHNGKPITINHLLRLLLENGNNITFSGGECTLQCRAFIKLAKKIKEYNKNIWLYSGMMFEEMILNSDLVSLLENIDVLVDGKFNIDKKDMCAIFKGSTNQRIINVGESLKKGGVIKYYA